MFPVEPDHGDSEALPSDFEDALPADFEPVDANQNLTRKATRAFVWAATAFGANRIVVFVSTLILARILAPDAFGIVAAATALITYFEVALDGGVGAAVIYDNEDSISHRVHVAFTVNLLVAVLLTGIVFLMAPLFAQVFGVPDEVDVFRAISFFLLFRGAGQVQNALLRRNMAFRARASVDVSRAVVRLVVSVGLALAGAGVWALIIGLLASEATGTIMATIRTRFLPRPVLDLANARSLLGFGVQTMAIKAIGVLSINADYLVVGAVLGATQLGFYSIGFRVPELALGSLLMIFSQVAYPTWTHARDRGVDVLRSGVLRTIRLTALYACVGGVLLAIASRDVVAVMFGAEWAPAAAPMAFISLSVAMAAASTASGDLFVALNRQGTLLLLNLLLAPMLVVGLVIGAQYGITAVAIAQFAFGVVYGLARMLVSNRLIGVGVAKTGRAAAPGIIGAVGCVALALPVRLLLDPGIVSLIAIGAAGTVGAFLAWALFARRQVWGALEPVVRALRSQGASPAVQT